MQASQKDVEETVASLIKDIEVPCEVWLKRWDNKFEELTELIVDKV